MKAGKRFSHSFEVVANVLKGYAPVPAEMGLCCLLRPSCQSRSRSQSPCVWRWSKDTWALVTKVTHDTEHVRVVNLMMQERRTQAHNSTMQFFYQPQFPPLHLCRFLKIKDWIVRCWTLYFNLKMKITREMKIRSAVASIFVVKSDYLISFRQVLNLGVTCPLHRTIKNDI